MTATKARAIPRIQCAPWCTDGDGHPNEIFRQDQRCYSPMVYVDSSLMDGQISAHARRDIDNDPVVELHVYGFPSVFDRAELDETLHFTADEARRLAVELVAAADNAEGVNR
jgi:hypothetical protein